MTRGAEETETQVASTQRPLPYPRTRRKVRVLSMVVYAGELHTWSHVLGIPNDTVGVFLWLWFGTIA